MIINGETLVDGKVAAKALAYSRNAATKFVCPLLGKNCSIECINYTDARHRHDRDDKADEHRVTEPRCRHFNEYTNVLRI